jgi:hypothetical protein
MYFCGEVLAVAYLVYNYGCCKGDNVFFYWLWLVLFLDIISVCEVLIIGKCTNSLLKADGKEWERAVVTAHITDI